MARARSWVGARIALVCILAVACWLWPSATRSWVSGIRQQRGRGIARRRRYLGLHAQTFEVTKTSELVTRLLEAIEGTDRGLAASEGQKAEISEMITELEAAGNGADFFASGTAYGKYEVAYVGASSSRVANPAGGRWRGRVGRIFFPTQGLYQHILPSEEPGADALAVNLVEASLLSLIPITVVLRGPASRLNATAREEVIAERSTQGGLTQNSVRANFDAPRVAFGPRAGGLFGLGQYAPLLRLSAGPRSSVVLDAPYVDDRIRIGKGASGIRFVFKRTTAVGADSWERAMAGPAVGSRAVGGVLACSAY
mmetsp:Transcript_84118/g.236419  ORF Transcript_84118/g.236419 Transcript_84118/m.236419 type:complete len:312 (-) Transcript_84118:155-1090(-)